MRLLYRSDLGKVVMIPNSSVHASLYTCLIIPSVENLTSNQYPNAVVQTSRYDRLTPMLLQLPQPKPRRWVLFRTTPTIMYSRDIVDNNQRDTEI